MEHISLQAIQSFFRSSYQTITTFSETLNSKLIACSDTTKSVIFKNLYQIILRELLPSIDFQSIDFLSDFLRTNTDLIRELLYRTFQS